MTQQRGHPSSSETSIASPLWKELDAIKRLLVLQLTRDGASQQQIAKALGVSQSSVSRMFSGTSAELPRPTRSSALQPNTRKTTEG